jgi:hypothetical protein
MASSTNSQRVIFHFDPLELALAVGDAGPPRV